MKPKIKSISIEEARQLDNCIWQLKRDGFLCYFHNGNLISNRLVNNTKKFPQIIQALKEIPKGTILLGEIYFGNNIFQTNCKENWHKCKYMVFDIFQHKGKEMRDLAYKTRLGVIKRIIPKSKYLELPVEFESFEQGWEWVKQSKSEGLVIRDLNGNAWKCKRLIEQKLRVLSYENPNGKLGTFVLERGRVSATSKEYIEQYHKLRAKGEVMCEIECASLTENGVAFQPRIRQLYVEV